MAKEVYIRTGLTGGSTTDLDGIDGNQLNDGDVAFVFDSNTSYIYQLDASSGASESSPDVIAPDTNPGTKRWILQEAYGTGGSSTFTGLSDTPSSYSGHAGEFVRVNSGETGLEFNTPAGSGDMLKSVYDTDDDGIVDNSEQLESHGGSYYLDRANHTGTQAASTISDFTAQVEADPHVSDAYTHSQLTSGNPHSVTADEVGLGNVSNLKCNWSAGAPPTAWDDAASGYNVGSRWVDTTNDEEYVCLDATNGAAVWEKTTAHTTAGADSTAFHSNVGAEIYALTEKSNLVGTDLLLIEDSEDSDSKKKVQVGNLISVSTPFSDDTPLLADETDDTKQLRFELAAISTGTTRVITVPDSDITLHNEGHDTTLDPLTGDIDFNGHDASDVALQTFHSEESVSGANVDWSASNFQTITLTADTTLTFTSPGGVAMLQLRVVQDATGGWSITWPTIKWEGGSAPSLTGTAGSEDLVFLYFNGTSYYGWIRKNFS